MKSFYFFILLISVPIFLMAQKPVTTKVPSNAYGPGGTLETTISTDEFGRTITTEKYYDARNRLREEFIKTRKLDNSGTEETTILYRENGTIRTFTKWDKYDDGTRKEEHKRYDENGNVTEGYIGVDIKGGSKVYYWDTVTKKFKGYDQVAMQFLDKRSDLICFIPKYEVFGGYSLLFGSSYPLGAHLNIKRSLTDRIGIGLDASTHRRKDGDLTISRSLVMIEGQYVFGDRKECDRDVIANIHVLVGIGRDHSKYKAGSYSSSSGETGPAFGGGGGVIMILSKKINAKVQGDILWAKWVDQWFDNLRFSGGLLFPLGKSKS